MQSVFNTFAASASETCDGKDCDIIYPEVAKKYIYWMVGMQFANAVLPYTYFATIGRYGYKRQEEDDFALFTQKKQVNKIPEQVSRDGDEDEDGGYGGLKRMWAWYIVAYTHVGVWSPGILLFILSFFGNLGTWYRFYMQHILSNLNYLAYISGVVVLAMVAPQTGAQGWLELGIYALLFAGAIFFVELVMGVRSLQALDRKFKYDDQLLIPSLFYLFGVRHDYRPDPNADKIEVTDDEFGFENDPSAGADVPIDEFWIEF